MDAFDELYEPSKFLDRAYRHYLTLGEATYPAKGKGRKKPFDWMQIRALLIICWRQGLLRSTRWQFWSNLWNMYLRNPGGVSPYLGVCAQIEHFLEYKAIVRCEIEAQLKDFHAGEAKIQATSAAKVEVPLVPSVPN
jgi:Domain of unknown function (DUF4070)